MVKQGTAEVQLGSVFVEDKNIKYGWELNLFKMVKQGTAGVFYIGKC